MPYRGGFCRIACSMKKGKLFYGLLLLALCLTLALGPCLIRKDAGKDWRYLRFERDKADFAGTIVLYHIVDARPFRGSLSYFLTKRAEEFHKLYPSVYIEVVGMSEADFRERLAYGRLPHALSFFAGSVTADDLDDFPLEAPSLRTGLPAEERALPWCLSYYVLAYADPAAKQKSLAELYAAGQLYAEDWIAARLGLAAAGETPDYDRFAAGDCAAAVVDLGQAGRLLAAGKLTQLSLAPLDAVTDEVCYMGVYRGTDAARAAWIARFYAFLTEEETQQKLSAYGLFTAAAEVADVFSDSRLQTLTEAYTEPCCCKPFLLAAQRDTLYQDAALAADGDEDAKQRFLERFHLVFPTEN